MKTPALLLALLLGGATALRAQTNREYNRLQEATNRAYSVPDRPVPSSTRAERSYTPSSSSSPNTPSSSGYSGSADYYSPQNVGKRIAEIERQGQMERDKQAAAAKRIEDDKFQAEMEVRVRKYREEEAAKALHSEVQLANLRSLLPTARALSSAGFSDHDVVRLAQIEDLRNVMPDSWQRLAEARQAQQAFAAQLAQPGGDFATLRELVGREWWITADEKAFGCYTALRDYSALQSRFPAQATALEADFIKVSTAMVVCEFKNFGASLDESLEYNPRADGIKELSKQFAVNPALVSQSIMASLEKVHSLIVWGHDKNKIPKAEEESFRLGTQMMYAIYQTELLQHPDNQELVKGLVASAEQLLYLVPNAPAATQAEWVMHRFEKMQDSSQLPMHLIENPSFLSALTDAQAQRVCPALGIALGDRARLARMLVDSLAIPDNPDWKALKEGQPLTKLIRQFATQYTKANGHRGELLLGTLDACTRHDKYGRNSARKHWEEAQRNKKPWPWSYSGNNDGFSPTPMVGATAGRNIYRAILLGQAGDYKEQSSISNKGDAIQALNSWRCDGNQGLYERALVMLDQSPTFPPIGVQQKKEARWQLTRAAAAGYAPAQAKLKEL